MDKENYTNTLYKKIENYIEPDCEDYYLAEIEDKSNKYDVLNKRVNDAISLLCDADRSIMLRKYSEANRYISTAKKVLRGEKND